MSEGTTGFLVFIGISILSGLLFHWKIRRSVLASLAAAVTATFLFQLGAYLQAGHLDPFFPIALVIGGAIAFAIAAVLGIPFVRLRRKKKDDHVA